MKQPRSHLLPMFVALLVLCLSITCAFAVWVYYPAADSVFEQFNVNLHRFYYGMVITNVSTVTQTVDTEGNSRPDDTAIKSSVTGKAGQTVVYEITAENFSKSTTYVFSGATVASGQVRVSTSSDQNDQNKIPSYTNANYTAGKPIAPGEAFTFYAAYTLTENVSNAGILINYLFKPVDYTVTYMDDNAIYAIDCITNKDAVYSVRTDYPEISAANVKFEYWMNASGIKVTSLAAGNTNSYTLNAKWNNIYSIIFVDADGSVIHQEHITVDTKSLSAEGKAVVDAKLAQLQSAVTEQHVAVKWSPYSFGKAQDIIVYAEYTYAGALKIVPVKNEGGMDDGIIDYYYVAPLDTLNGEENKSIVIPGKIGNAYVRSVNRVTNEAGNDDWNNFNESIERITVGEGVERLEHNSLSYTPKLHTVYLPNTLTYLGKNAFSRNTPSDNKKLTIYYNGTMTDWEKLIADSDGSWDGGLRDNSIVVCTDGYYQADTSEIFGAIISRSWKKHRHTYGSSCPSGCPTNAPI